MLVSPCGFVRKYRARGCAVASRIDNVVHKGEIRLEDVNVLWKSDPVPQDPFVCRNDLCQEARATYRRPDHPIVVVCIDGGDSACLEHGVAAGIIPNIERTTSMRISRSSSRVSPASRV